MTRKRKPWKPSEYGPNFYVLRGKLAVPVKDPLEWGMEFEKSHRVVQQTEFQNMEPWLSEDTQRHKEMIARHKAQGFGDNVLGDAFLARIILVSTVFIGLDMSYRGPLGGDPLLFETLVFNGPLDGEGERYSSWDEAEKGHAAVIERVRAALADEMRASAVVEIGGDLDKRGKP
jgi:hypothetical protein